MLIICVLGRALQVVDDALRSAAEVKNQTSEVVDKKFEIAIEMLSGYETDHYPKGPTLDNSRAKTVRERMEEATTKDKCSSGILNKLKEKLKVRTADPPLDVLLLPTPSQFWMESWSQRQLSSSFSLNPFMITTPPS